MGLLKIAPDLNDSQLDEVIDIGKETKIDGIISANTSTTLEGLKTDAQKLKAIG